MMIECEGKGGFLRNDNHVTKFDHINGHWKGYDTFDRDNVSILRVKISVIRSFQSNLNFNHDSSHGVSFRTPDIDLHRYLT